MGLLVESSAIAASLAERLDDLTFAYRVEAEPTGRLVWIENRRVSPPRTYGVDPNTTTLQRAVARFVGLLPVEWML
jgi:putative cardiolipin synthase